MHFIGNMNFRLYGHNMFISIAKGNDIMKKMVYFLKGSLIGLLNGFFGSGGGVIAVPIMEKDCSVNEAHATSVVLIFVLSFVTAISYGFSGNLDFDIAMDYIPWGVIGAFLGALFLKKLKPKWVRKIFGGLVTVAAVRMLIL